ncbi:MAG: ABC transporter substrate-binding protein [Aeromonadales bacterium]|nr:ABC transporter substrate-binding protein [Aeromonadales bacterium]
MRLILALLLFSTATQAAEPVRLLSAGSSITELVLALGAEPQLVAVDSTSEVPNNKALPKLGYHRQLSAEGILSTQPNLVIGSEEMGPESALSLVRQAGVRVETVPEAQTVAQLQSNILRLGDLLNASQQSQALHNTVAQRASLLANKLPKKNPKSTIFLLLGDGNTVQIAGRDTLANSMIQVAGGTNPAVDEVKGYKPVAMEAIVAMAPEVILISRRSLTKEDPMAQLFKQFPLLRHTPAAQQEAIVPINGKALIGGFGLSTLAEAERLHQHWLAAP